MIKTKNEETIKETVGYINYLSSYITKSEDKCEKCGGSMTLPGSVTRKPWGHYEILSDTPTHKVKSITVKPSGKLSLQKHKKRDEHWIIVAGVAHLELDGNSPVILKPGPGGAAFIKRDQLHRVSNGGLPAGLPDAEDLVFIEVQVGDYFGEDDIERIEDDYGRN